MRRGIARRSEMNKQELISALPRSAERVSRRP